MLVSYQQVFVDDVAGSIMEEAVKVARQIKVVKQA